MRCALCALLQPALQSIVWLSGAPSVEQVHFGTPHMFTPALHRILLSSVHDFCGVDLCIW